VLEGKAEGKMVESYRQRHGPKRPPASARLGILLGFALVAFIVLGLILRALGAGAVLLSLALFALGLALGWHARGQRQPAQKVAALPVRPANQPTVEEVSPARAYALQVLELDTPASTQERSAIKDVESIAEPLARAPEPIVPQAVEPVSPVQAAPEVAGPRAETTERKKWSPRAKVDILSSTPETTVALTALETTTLETKTPIALEPANFEPANLEPANLEPANLERKKWTPKSPKNKVLDTLSGTESSSLEPETESEPLSHRPVLLEASAYPETELPDIASPDANTSPPGAPARKKWTPKVKQESLALEQAALLEVPESHTALEPVQSAKLDSRQILESMGIHLPAAALNSSVSTAQMDSSTPVSSKLDSSGLQGVQASSGRRQWIPRRKA